MGGIRREYVLRLEVREHVDDAPQSLDEQYLHDGAVGGIVREPEYERGREHGEDNGALTVV